VQAAHQRAEAKAEAEKRIVALTEGQTPTHTSSSSEDLIEKEVEKLLDKKAADMATGKEVGIASLLLLGGIALCFAILPIGLLMIAASLIYYNAITSKYKKQLRSELVPAQAGSPDDASNGLDASQSPSGVHRANRQKAVWGEPGVRP
jgi:hypothetical protein